MRPLRQRCLSSSPRSSSDTAYSRDRRTMLSSGSMTARQAVAVTVLCAAAASAQTDPLPSWNDGAAKRAIVAFVQRTTSPGSPDFVAPEERVATFDNDGTLWVEKPLPTEVYFILARLRALAANDPSLRTRQPYKAALEGDADYFHAAGAKASVELVLKTETHMTQEDFARQAKAFLDTAWHPMRQARFTSLVYAPMLELLRYLEANGFQTWICSGGTTDFMRAFAPATYGIPTSRIIGSEFRRVSKIVDGRRIGWRDTGALPPNDKEMKAVSINKHIKHHPLLAAGNVMSGGDGARRE